MALKRSRRDYEADQRKYAAPFVVYGTPLPSLDDNARDDGSYLPLWKQEVTDSQGRKRLHGAFTGGFSAGYFNSVGSKEGWAPSTFVSSRSNRAKDAKIIRRQKIEDYMDDEDIKDRDETEQLAATDGFAGFGTGDDQNVQHALDEIFKPVEHSIGDDLLSRMGWKKGQGIGPRVIQKIDPSDPDSEVREFPPEDSPMLEFSRKADLKGLGHGAQHRALPQAVPVLADVRMGTSQADDDRPGLSFMRLQSGKTKAKVRPGLGLASLDNTTADEEDAYDNGPKISYNRVLGDDRKTLKSKTANIANANPLLKSKPVFVSRVKVQRLPTALESLKKCHDGKLPLANFVLAIELDGFSGINHTHERFEPPIVPEDWEPANLKSDLSTPPSMDRSSSTDQSAAAPQQTITTRRLALNEAALPSKSVFDFLSPAARDRLASATGNSNLPPALSEALPSQSSARLASELDVNSSRSLLSYPYLDPTVASAALTRLRKDKSSNAPYATDLPKQGRYKDFLRYSADPLPADQRVPPLRAPDHKHRTQPSSLASAPDLDSQHIKELMEFVATADLYKPVTGFFASRFTSAATTTADNEQNGNFGPNGRSVGDGTGNSEAGGGEVLSQPIPKAKDPAEEAAIMGIFGNGMTRTVKGWMPTRLVCKRFAVEMPIDFD